MDNQTLDDGNPSNLRFKTKCFHFDVSALLECIDSQLNLDQNELIIDLLMEYNESDFLSDELIKDFVSYANNERVELSIDKLFPLYAFANILNKANLIELINKYIADHMEDFINKLYHINATQTHIKTHYFENIISENLLDYVKYEKLSLLKLSTIHRILTKYQLKNGSIENQDIYDFLFKVLLNQGPNASFLFSFLNDPIKNEYILRKLIVDEYSELFDFHFIDESFSNIAYKKQSSYIKQYIESKLQQNDIIDKLISNHKIELEKMKEEINQFKEDKSIFVTNEQREIDLENIRKEFDQLKESMSLFVTKEQHEDEVKKLTDEINELKEEKVKLQQLQTIKIDKLKKVVFESSKCTGPNDNLEVFNGLSGEAQNFIFSGLMNNAYCSPINQKIGSLLLFLSNEYQKSKSDKDIKDNYICICSNQMNESLSKLISINSIEIKSNIISVLYENGSIDSEEFINNIINFDDLISIEYQYPLLDRKVYEVIKTIKQTKCQKMKINFFISGIEKTTNDFQRQQEINKITFDSSVKIITGGLGQGSFEYCTNVTELNLSNSITLIGGGAFNAFHNLKELIIPSSVKTIEGGAFSECFLLSEITFPPELKEVQSDAFRKCQNLKLIIVDPYNTTIKPNAFPECPLLKHFTLHPSIKTITKLNLDHTSLYDIRELIIPETVTSISSDAFSTCRNLYKITILPSMKSIGCIGANHLQCIEVNPFQTNIEHLVAPALNHFVFHSSVNHIEYINLPLFRRIKKITIPDTVTSIAPGSFYGYSLLEEINIPNSISIIEHDTFKNCEKLKNIIIPSSVKRIHGGVFCECFSLEGLTISNSVEFIGGGCFSYCKALKKITLPNSLKSIENHLFIHCDCLYEVNIPNTVSLINRNAFDCCPNLQNITIPKSLTTIGYKSFVGMSIRTIFIPNTVRYIEEEAFCGCLNLTEVKFAKGSKLSKIGEKAFYKCSSLKSINMPDSVSFIGKGAFSECSQLDNISLPNSLTSIEDDLFYHCTSLKNIYIETCYNIKFLGSGSFNNCAITQIRFPYSVRSIGRGTFYCCEKLQTIDEYAFYGCKSLTSIPIYQVSYLGQGAFENCQMLQLICHSKNITKIEPYTFKNCSSLQSIPLIQKYIKSIGKEAFYGCQLNDLYLVSSLTSIEKMSFSGCNLTSIVIPNSVTSIEESAFYDCQFMIEVSIPPSVKSIADSAFYNCRSLKQIKIPKSVRKIGQKAFSQCISLIEVTFDNDSLLEEFEREIFNECKSLQRVQIPSSVISIGDYVFYNCEALEYVQFDNPCQVKEFGNYTFRGCKSLKEIKIPSSLRNVGNYAFSCCDLLKSFTFPSYVKVGENVFYRPLRRLRRFNYFK